MGRPELAEDPRFKTVLDRLKHIDLTDQAVSEWSSRYTRNEIVEACRAHRVPCSAVRDLLEVTEDHHLHARGMLREIEHPEYGDILVHRSPLVLHDTETPDYVPSARLGQHNGEILSEYLGLSAAEVDALRQSGAISQA
jgi:crotonobetainyl-CoA:carnitine CoA-transferase CaiB-like acyl-CoA transferase